MPQPASDPVLEANKAVVRRIFEEAWNEATFENVAGDIAEEAHFHFRGEIHTTNVDGLRRLVDGWRQAFPDLYFYIHALIAEGDQVAIRLTFTGTHSGAWKGVAPTGRAIEVTEMMFFRFEDGRIVEMWEDFDETGMMQQLGVLG